MVVTAEYGMTLLDAELRPIVTKELPIDKLATVAFNEATGELFYAASEGSSDAKKLMKVAVSGDAIGEPTSVGTVPETIRGIGVDPDSGKFFAISAESGDDSARENGGHLTIFDASQDKRSIALPKTAEVLGAKVIDGESVYAKIFNNDDFAEVTKMNDGTFIFHPGAAVTLEGNDITTKVFLFSIDLNVSDDAFKYMKGSQYLERTALSGLSTDGESILRSTHFGRGGAQMLKYADRDVSPVTESIQLSGGELWAGSVFHDGKSFS